MTDKNKKSSLTVNYIFNFISQVLSLIVPLVTTPYLARIFHEEGNGQISFASTIISYFVTFAALGFGFFGQREIAKSQNNPSKQKIVFWNIFFGKLISTVLSAVTLVFLVFFNAFGEKYQLLLWVFSIQVVAVPFDITFYFQGNENFRSIAIKTIIFRLLSIACIFIFVKSSEDLWIYALCFSLATLIANIIMWPSALKIVGFIPFRELSLKAMWKPVIVIFLPALAVTVYASLDKVMIGYLATNPDYDNGCYNQALKINQTILILITVIDSIMVARNSSVFGKGDKESLKNNLYFAFNYVWFFGIPLIAGMCLLSHNLSSWYLGSGYDEVPILLCIMSVRFLASGFTVVIGNELFIVIGKEKITTIATLATGVINLGLNFILIPRLGSIGAAITTAVSEIVCAIILMTVCFYKKYLSIKKVFLMAIKPTIGIIPMIVSVYFLNKIFTFSPWSFLILAIIGMFIYFLTLFIVRDKFLLMGIHMISNKVKSLVNRRKKNCETIEK